MVTPVNNASANAASAALRSKNQAVDMKPGEKPAPGKLPYTRSQPMSRTSMESPHVPGAPGKLGSPRVNIDPRGLPTHLLFSDSNGKVGVAHKVKKEATIASDAGAKPHASAPSPHVPGASGALGRSRVNVDPNGVPSHLIAEQNGEVVLARKVKRTEA